MVIAANSYYNFSSTQNIFQTDYVKNTISHSSTQNTNTILGYEVDKDGFFTEEFNKAAGIAKEYKIYAKGAENLVNYISAHPKTHTNIDFAKSLGNVYKLFLQIAPKTGSTNFSQEQLNALPIGFEYDTKSFKVLQTYTYEQMQQMQDYVGEHTQFAQIFPSPAGTNEYFQGKSSSDIFKSNIFIDIGANAYKNTDGSIEKGGALMAFFSARIGQHETSFLVGETTIRGKLAGLDENISQEQIADLQAFIEQNPIEYGPIADLVAILKLKGSTVSIEEFKSKWLEFKQKSDEIQMQMQSTQASVPAAMQNPKESYQTHNPNEESKNFTPLQVISKSQTYKDLNFFTMNNLLQDQYKFNMFEMLFGKNTIKTSINIRA